MTKAKVYMTDFRVPVGLSLPEKLKRLCRRAGMEKEIDFEGKYTAIKMHFWGTGQSGIPETPVRPCAGRPCKGSRRLPLTDCNTLYPGSRKNALEHLECAALNGYNPITTGCQVLIGDGLRGTDEVEVPVPGGEYIKKAKIGRAIMDADVFISLAHFKGHESTGFGGAIKNIGMAAEAGPARWSSTLLENLLSMSRSAVTANAAPRNAVRMPSLTKRARPTSIRRDALAAAAVSGRVPLMPLKPWSGMPTSCLTVRWRNMPWPSFMAGLLPCEPHCRRVAQL